MLIFTITKRNTTVRNFKLSLGFHEKIIRIELIHDLRLEFVEKT